MNVTFTAITLLQSSDLHVTLEVGNNISGQSGPTKQKRSFQTGELENNNVSDINDSKCRYADEIRLSVVIAGLLLDVYFVHIIYYLKKVP